MKKASRTDPEGFERRLTRGSPLSLATMAAAVGLVASRGTLVLQRPSLSVSVPLAGSAGY